MAPASAASAAAPAGAGSAVQSSSAGPPWTVPSSTASDDRGALRDWLVAGGFGRTQARAVAAAAEWSAVAVERSGGVSRLGGPAVLPKGRPWPRRAGRPLTFVGVIDLREVPAFPGRDALPADGSIVVFAALDTEESGPSTNRPGGAGRILYAGPSTPLVGAKRPKARRPLPRWATRAKVRPIPLAFVPWLGPPDWEHPSLSSLGLRRERTLDDWLGTEPGPGGDLRGTGVRLLGVPRVEQADPREDGQASLINLDPDAFGVEYLDLGTITFLGRPRDVAGGDWTRVWMWGDSG